MELYGIIAIVIFTAGLFLGLYIGKCRELRRVMRTKGKTNNSQKNNQGEIVILPQRQGNKGGYKQQYKKAR